jgi:hypothetical protein
LLDSFEISTAIQQVRCKRVAQGVGGRFGRQAGSDCPSLNNVLDGSCGEGKTFFVGEEGFASYSWAPDVVVQGGGGG